MSILLLLDYPIAGLEAGKMMGYNKKIYVIIP